MFVVETKLVPCKLVIDVERSGASPQSAWVDAVKHKVVDAFMVVLEHCCVYRKPSTPR